MANISNDPVLLQQQTQQKIARHQRPSRKLHGHKRRSVWYRERSAWPYRDAVPHQLQRERVRVARELSVVPDATLWESVGPSNIGGRMTCGVCDPQRPERIWAGAAGGGVWMTEDAGLHWVPLWHDQPSLNIGALALDPSDSNTIYCGTGEANLSADSYPGAGLFRSDDQGRTWLPVADPERHGIPVRIGTIAINPFDRKHICVGGVGHYYGGDNPGGLYTSRNGGRTWERASFVSEQPHWCHAILFHPGQPGLMYAAMTEKGRHSGLWRSHDSGRSWEHLSQGLPAPEQCGRSSIALCAAYPHVMYALISNAARGVEGVFRSQDGGDLWQPIHGEHFALERQMSYNNAIVVHPKDPDVVICGGVDIHRTKDGGQHWDKVTEWSARRGQDAHYAHADQHAFVIPAAMPERVYAFNDGGMDVSDDLGQSWQNRSDGLAITMFYDLDVAQYDVGVLGGGAQDNGTLLCTNGTAGGFFPITGGDGGWIVLDPQDDDRMFASIYNMQIFRYRGAEGWVDVSPPEDASVKQRLWMVYIAMDQETPARLLTGSQRVWQTLDDGDSWQPISESFDDSFITCIEIARADSRRLYVGTTNGGFFRSVDGGLTWSANLAGSVLPGYTITRICSRPDNAAHLLVTVANFGHSHVFRSRDGGRTWEDVDGGMLPDVPHHAIAIPASHPHEVYVANDIGVFVSEDFGDTWRHLSRNLPHVQVVDLVFHEASQSLLAATYGRSIWRLQVRASNGA